MQPDFDAVRGKRMSELTPEQTIVARELWVRENIGWLLHGHDHIPFLLERLDAARADNGMRNAMVKLSRALGHPKTVDGREGQSVEAVLIETAAEKLSALATLKEVELNIIRFWPDGMPARLEHVWRDLLGLIPNYKLYDLQRTLAEFGFTMKVYENAEDAQEVPRG